MNSFLENVLAGGISGIVSGGIVGYVLYRMQKRIEESQRTNLNLSKLKKRLPGDVLKYIQPGSNWEKVKESLGQPDHHYDTEMGNFTDPSDPVSTNSYVYNCLNANLKIITKDNISVDTVSIFINDDDNETKYKIELPFPVNEGKVGYLGVSKVTPSMLEHLKHHTLNRTIREMIWGIETYAGWASGYMSYSYFGYYLNGFENYDKAPNPQYFIGAIIDGICISSIETFAPAISIYEK